MWQNRKLCQCTIKICWQNGKSEKSTCFFSFFLSFFYYVTWFCVCRCCCGNWACHGGALSPLVPRPHSLSVHSAHAVSQTMNDVVLVVDKQLTATSSCSSILGLVCILQSTRQSSRQKKRATVYMYNSGWDKRELSLWMTSIINPPVFFFPFFLCVCGRDVTFLFFISVCAATSRHQMLIFFS